MRGLLFALLLLLAGCGIGYVSPYGYGGVCAAWMDQVREGHGVPEEVQAYDSSGFSRHTWWYWSIGWSAIFTWGEYVDGCDYSTYTFQPITP